MSQLSESREDRWLDLDLAAANVNRAGTLVGSTIAVFTFLLFFLYPRYSSGQIDPTLFQLTLTIIILTILTFSLSGLYYYRVGVLKLSNAKKRASMQRGALFWLFGTLFVILEPALILFTVGLTGVGLIALLAWLLYTLVTLRDASAYGNLYGGERYVSPTVELGRNRDVSLHPRMQRTIVTVDACLSKSVEISLSGIQDSRVE